MGRVEERYRLSIAVGVAIVCLGAFAGAAGAASGTAATSGAKHTSAQGQYGNGGPVKPVSGVKAAVTSASAAATTTAPPTVDEGALPFTGVSLVGVAGLGAVLVAIGVAMFRRGGSRP